MKALYALIYILFFSTTLIAQVDSIHYETSSLEDLISMDLNSLLNITITSASKKKETALESPLSTSVISKDEIINSGATTLEDLFRLIPGVIVRETSNGNFDLHIRGFDNTPSHNYMFETVNTTTLVMINNQKVYNHLNGGTLWETLPVSLTDIEQIEIIRGPSTALYGPNAVSGVINIITKKELNTNPLSVKSQVQGGNLNTLITNTTILGNLSPSTTIGMSFNSDYRDRNQTTYWNYKYDTYTNPDSFYDYTFVQAPRKVTNLDKWSKPKLAKQKLGANAFVNYVKNEDVKFYISTAYQKDEVQAILMENNTTPFTRRNSETFLTNLNSKIKNFSLNASNILGTQDIYMGYVLNPVKYDFNTSDIFAEYDISIKKTILRPGIQYQFASYNDDKYIPINEDGSKTVGFLNSKKTLTNIAPTLRLEHKFNSKLRVIAALRGDIYNLPNKMYFSYQLIGTYSFNKNNLLRFVASKANRGPTMVQMYTDINTGSVIYSGNTDLKLLEQYTLEIGSRHILNPNLQAEFEFYYNYAANFSSFQLNYDATISNQGIPTAIISNIPTVAKQVGFTSSLRYNPTEKLILKPNITFQYTHLYQAPTTVTTDLEQKYNDRKHTQTPNIYGGISAQYSIHEKLILFSNFYYLAPQVFDFYIKNGNTPATARLDAKISYKVWKQNAIFFNARNLLNPKQNEFAWADQLGGLYLIGLDLNF